MTDDGVFDAKKATRRRVLALRDALTGEERQDKSAAISERLIALPAFADAGTVAAYASFATEFDTGPFLHQVLVSCQHLLQKGFSVELRTKRSVGGNGSCIGKRR